MENEKSEANAEVEAMRRALQAARLELELSKSREQKLLSDLRLCSEGLSNDVPRKPLLTRCAFLMAIGGLAAWQVYLTLKLQVLLH